MKGIATKVGAFFSDRRIVLLLMATSALVALAYLVAWTEPIGRAYRVYPPWFAPAAMLASGRGFVNPNISEVPALVEFMEQRKTELIPGRLPEEIPTLPLTGFHQTHRYLLYAAAITWRLCGISWNALKLLLVVFFCASVGMVYGIFRLGANRLLSAAGAALFMLTPSVLTTLPSVRDFCKAPFILATILIAGRLAKKPLKTRAFLALTALLGLTLGIGLGFRQDLLICLLPSVAVVLFSPQPGAGLRVPRRVIAVALLLVCFFVPARPILENMRAEGSTTSHHMVMGLATVCDDNLGVAAASYERVYEFSDFFAFASVSTYACRAKEPAKPISFGSRDAAQAGTRFLAEVAKTFPGDLVTRAYAAVIRVLRDARVRLGPPPWTEHPFISKTLTVHWPLAMHFERYALVYAVLALALLSCRSFRLAWVTLLFLLYFCGSIALQFELRHCFHLSFAPLWFLALLIQMGCHALGRLAQPAARQQMLQTLWAPRQWWTPKLRQSFRGLLRFSMAAGLVILFPLYLGRAYQSHRMGPLLEKYARADLAPLEVVKEPLDDWVAFNMEGGLASKPDTPGPSRSQYQAHYLAAELASSGEGVPVWLRYKGGASYTGFPAFLTVPGSGASGQGTTRYFFPVYETQVPPQRSVFEGIALPQEHAAKFRGLARVTDPTEFPLLLNLALPTAPASLRPHQTLAPEAQVHARVGARFEREGFHDAALGAYRLANALEPADDEIRARLVDLVVTRAAFHQQRNNYDEAVELCREANILDPGDAEIRARLAEALLAKGRFLRGRKQHSEALGLYREAIALDAENAALRSAEGEVLAELGDLEGAAAAYRQAIRIEPDAPVPYRNLDRLYGPWADPEAQVAAWREVVREIPKAARPYHYLGRALEGARDIDGAVEAHRQAVALAPSEAEMQAGLGYVLVRKGDFPGAVEAFRAALKIAPEMDYLRPELIRALCETEAYAAAWEQVRHCRDKGVALPQELAERPLEELARRSGRQPDQPNAEEPARSDLGEGGSAQ